MTQLDDTFLTDVGLEGLPEEEKGAFLSHIHEELKLRIGEVISKDLSEDKLVEFERLSDGIDQHTAKEWFEENYPTYKSVVSAEIEKLKHEIIDNRDQLLSIS